MFVQQEHPAMLRDRQVDSFSPAVACLTGSAALSAGSGAERVPPGLGGASGSEITTPIEHAVDYIVDECFFTVGQAVGTRRSLDAGAVIWWRDHYRMRFLATMRRFGNRWHLDEKNVKAVARMLAERAVAYAGASLLIDRDSAMKATADVERYCSLHAARRARHEHRDTGGSEAPWMVGYWCEGELPLAV